MIVESIPVKIAGDPHFTTNCYIVSATSGCDQVVVIDPGDEPELILERIGSRSLSAIIVTHGHYDHIGGVARLAEATGAKMYAHADDAAWIQRSFEAIKSGYAHFIERANAKQKESEAPSLENDAPDVDFKLVDGEVLEISGLSFLIMHTPGHSRGSISLYDAVDSVLFSGDTLFRGTCGRIDFPGGSAEKMHDSLAKLSQLPPETIVYPGHDAITTIGEELNRGLSEY